MRDNNQCQQCASLRVRIENVNRKEEDLKTIDCNYFVIGSGMSGLMTALHLAPHGRTLLVTKRRLEDCNSNFAQGGICCVADERDSLDDHVRDTQVAGAGLCDEAVVRQIVAEAEEGIRDLIGCGVKFAKKEDGSWDLGREGGHSARRIFHAGDITGQKCEAAMVRTLRKRGDVEVRENSMVIDLITTDRTGRDGDAERRCVGAYVLDVESGEIYAVRARHTVLATGGCGKVYLYTCNPDVATGDGVALAWRAGAKIENMEFVQFHPTCLYHPGAKRFLISEAVRGEGAILTDLKGKPFMDRYDGRGSLAPRDIVARAIDSEMKRTGAPYCCLDIRFKGREYLSKRFPNIYRKCLEFGIDMAKDLIPIVPAAHYCCGGVKATVDGKTSLAGLSAVGETACTGLHGANRLASNSLMEALVTARLTAKRLAADRGAPPRAKIPEWVTGSAVEPDEAVLVSHMWDEVRRLMWDYVGIVRTDKRLARARHRLHTLRREIREYYFNYLVTPDTLELRNLAVCAELIVKSAQRRKESRGLHYTLDYPEKSERIRNTVLPGFKLPAGRREGGQ